MAAEGQSGMEAQRLTAARLFDEPLISGPAVDYPRPSPDGRLVAFSKPAADDPRSGVLWLMDVEGGQTRPLLDMRALSVSDKPISEDAFRAQQRAHAPSLTTVINYAWRADSAAVIVFHGGNLHLVMVGDGAITNLTTTGDVDADPQLTSDGAYVSFVRGRNLIIKDLLLGLETAMGADVSPTVGYGVVEFVVQEELRRFSGSWWSPDGRKLAYTRVDESAVVPIPRLGIDTSRLVIVDDRYPLAGAANACTRLFIRNIDTQTTVEAPIEFGDDAYLADVDWACDGQSLLVQRLSRDQQQLDLLSVDADGASVRTLISETSDTWVDMEHDVQPLAGGEFLWGSTRTGWRHLYLYGAGGELIRPVTQGDWRISPYGPTGGVFGRSIVGVDEDAGILYFTASIETPLERHLYRQSYRTPGEPQRLTDTSGWWVVGMASAAPTSFVGIYSDPETPPNAALYALDGTRVAWINQNSLDNDHPLIPYLAHRPRYEFGALTAENGEALHYLMVKPYDFDPTRRYPVIVRVYGGPGPQLVRRAWQSLTDQYWTQAGYILFTLDNRGSGNRSRAFEHVLRLDLGAAPVEDQMVGLDFLRTLPFVDVDHIGMSGWSFGGYMTMRLMSEPAAGICAGSVGGVPAAFALYDTCYTERYIGKPNDEPQAYAKSDLIPRLHRLSGELLLMQGLSDDNVLLINYVTVVEALQKHGKLFDSMVYPGQGHVTGGKVAGPHVLRSTARFFARHLGGEFE